MGHKKLHKILFPHLTASEEKGLVRFDGNLWVGKASDGVEVILGHTSESAERYLASNPTPDTW